MIPYKFHFIWIQGFESCPFKKNYLQCQKINPKIEFYFWDEPQILDLLDSTPWIPYRDQVKELYINEKVLAGKADIARYFIIYVYGGVYIDMDYQCIQSFIPTLDAYGSKIDLAVVLTKDFLFYIKPILHGKLKGKKYFLNNGFFASKPQHDLLKHALESCIQNKNQKILIFRTGTLIFYQSFQKIFQKEEKTKTLILPKMYYQPLEMFYCDYKAQMMNDKVMIHSNNFSYKQK
jgi:mannosyltransferase OCH1-like enzyme